MDSPQHCRDRSAECIRAIQSAKNEAEVQALKNLSRTWVGLAGQIDRYNALIRAAVGASDGKAASVGGLYAPARNRQS
jgi:monomeric isocitrate dehydrogenase